uniref:Uncharacterized protein n=1 Tax=Oryza punctata TaxID=4537 RepID=A0A0E0MN23_ORYPU
MRALKYTSQPFISRTSDWSSVAIFLQVRERIEKPSPKVKGDEASGPARGAGEESFDRGGGRSRGLVQ